MTPHFVGAAPQSESGPLQRGLVDQLPVLRWRGGIRERAGEFGDVAFGSGAEHGWCDPVIYMIGRMSTAGEHRSTMNGESPSCRCSRSSGRLQARQMKMGPEVHTLWCR